MKQKTTSLLAWFALLLAFVVGSADVRAGGIVVSTTEGSGAEHQYLIRNKLTDYYLDANTSPTQSGSYGKFAFYAAETAGQYYIYETTAGKWLTYTAGDSYSGGKNMVVLSDTKPSLPWAITAESGTSAYDICALVESTGATATGECAWNWHGGVDGYSTNTMGFYTADDANSGWFLIKVSDIVTEIPARAVTNAPVYTITSPNSGTAGGSICYNTANADNLYSSKQAGLAYSQTDANMQFAFIRGALGTYLYNVGSGKFVQGQNHNVDHFTLTTDLASIFASSNVTLLSSTLSTYNTYYPTVMQIGNGQVHVKPNHGLCGVVCWNNTEAPNNSLMIVPVDEVDLTSVYTTVANVEANYINSLIQHVGEVGYRKTTTTSYLNLIALRDAILAGTAGTDASSVTSNKAIITAYQNDTETNDYVLPENGGIYSITGYVRQGVSINDATVNNFYIYNEDGTFTVSSAASATEANNLWMAVVDGSNYSFRSVASGKYLSAETGLVDAAYVYSPIETGAAGRPYLSMYSSSLAGGRWVGVGYANSRYQFGKTGGSGYYGQSKTQSGWSTDFLFTENANYVPYTVSITGAPEGQTPVVAYGGWTSIANGQLFPVLSSASVTTAEITPSAYAGYTSNVTVDNNAHTVTVTYTCETLTYSYKFNGTEVGSEVFTPTVGDALPAPTAVPFGYTYTAPTGTFTDAQKGTTIDVPLTWSLFTYADSYANISQWYKVRIHSNYPHYLYNNNGSIAFADAAGGNEYLWAFVGDPINGFTIYNNKGGDAVAIDNADPCTLSAAGISAKFKVYSGLAGSHGSSADSYFALYATAGSYLNYQSGAIKRWSDNDNGSTFMINAATVLPEYTITFTDGTNPVEVSVNGGTASSTYTFEQGTPPTSIGSGADYNTYTLNGTNYYGRSIIDAIAALDASATISISTPSGAITVTDVNGNALDPNKTYLIRNAGNSKYMWTNDDLSCIGPYPLPVPNNYRYSVEGHGANIIIKSVFADKYLNYSSLSEGAGLIAPSATTADAAMTVNAQQGSKTNGWALSAAGNYYLNFYNGGNLGFLTSASASDASNTWEFVPARRLSFVDGSGNPIVVKGQVGDFTLDYDWTAVNYPASSAWTKIYVPSLLPNVVTYTINGTTYTDYNMSALCEALNALTEDATITVAPYAETIAVNDHSATPQLLNESMVYYVKFPGRDGKYLTQSGNYVKPAAYNVNVNQLHKVKAAGEYLSLVLPYHSNSTYLGVSNWTTNALANGADKAVATTDGAKAFHFKAIAQDAYDDCYVLQAGSGLGNADPAVNYFSNFGGGDNNMGFYSAIDGGAYVQFVPAITIRVQTTTNEALPVTVNGVQVSDGFFCRPLGENLSSLLVNGMPIGESTVATITLDDETSTQYTGPTAILEAINALTEDATVSFTPLRLSFVDLHGIPMKTDANDTEYANGVITLVQGQTLSSLTPPIRLATYQIGETENMNSQQVIDAIKSLTANTTIICNAYYNLTFKNESGATINSEIRGGGVTLPNAASHEVGMHCVIDKVLLDGYTQLNNTYVLQGEEYDILGFYAAVSALQVAQGANVTVTVKVHSADLTVKDINGNVVVPGQNYYVVFPGRGNRYFGTSGASATNYSLKLNDTRSYVEATGNPQLFQVEGNGQYIRLKPSRTNITPEGTYYVASTDVSEGADKASLMSDAAYTLVFRAEQFKNYTNCYGLRVSNHNGTAVTYLNNYGGPTYNMGFRNNMDDGSYLQFVPFTTNLTLNFVDTNNEAVSVKVYKNTDANQSTVQNSGTAVSSMTFNVSGASDKAATLADLQSNRYFYINGSDVGMNAVKYTFNSTDYTSWADVLSSGAAEGGTVYVTLAATGVQPMDIYGNPVIAGRKYRIARYSNNLQYLTKNNADNISGNAEQVSGASQYWTVTPAADWSTMTLTVDGNTIKWTGVADNNTTTVAASGTTANIRSVLVDRTTHYYMLETTQGDVSARLSNTGITNYNFLTGTPGVGAKFAFIPAGGVVDAYNSELVAERTYRIEMPAKVGQTDFPAGRPVTLTITAENSNSAGTPTCAIATSVEQYRTYYWLPDTYTGLDYMYNDLQTWTVEPVSGTEAGYRIKSSSGYLKVASYSNQAAVSLTNDQSEATTFYGESAIYEGLTNIYGFYTVDTNADSPTKLYLCTPGTRTAMKIVTSYKQNDNRWWADCVFRFTPVKEQTLADAYNNGSGPVKAKGFDCFGPGKAGKGLVWNSSTKEYEESPTDIIDVQNMLTGAGDKHDSIVGYHLPDRVFLAYDYATSAYKETVDFTAPELIGYNGNITSTKTADGYYEYTGYTLKNYPIVASPAPKLDGSGAYIFDANTNWYMIVLRDCDRKELIDNNLQAVTNINSITNPFVDKFLFCFVGDPQNGYLVYNKARGAGHFMGPKGVNGDNQAHWHQANNVNWIPNTSTMTDAQRNKARIFFQMLQHDNSGYVSFVDRYTGFSLDRWNNYVVYWHGRPIHNGAGYDDNGLKGGETENSTKIGGVPNSFWRGGNRLEARTMGFPLVADLYSNLLKSAVESGYLASLVGYVGLFRSEQDILDRYNVYLNRVAAAAANSEYTDAQYKAELTDAYNAYFNWLNTTNDEYGTETNGVEFQNPRYYYLRSVATGQYLTIVPGQEGAESYSFTTTDNPESLPGAVWQFDEDQVVDASYASERGRTHKLRNVYWNADLKLMDATSGNETASVVLGDNNVATLDVYNDMNAMENPGQYVIRTAAGGYLNDSHVCLSLIGGNVEAHQGRVGGGERRWYIVPLLTETPTSQDAWTDEQKRVEEFTTVTIPENKTWINGTTIGEQVAEDLIFTTYCNPERAVAFPHNSNIYAFRAVNEVGSTAIFLEQLDDVSGQTIPAGMGVVMLAPNGKMIPFLPVASSGVTNTESLLVSAGDDLEKNTVAAGNYVFVYKKNTNDQYVLKFYKAGSKGVSLGYHRAYLPSSSLDYATRSLSNFSFDMLFDDGVVTKVTLPMTDTEDGEDFNGGNTGTYDMQGRRVDNPTKPGVYIINGRKVYVK